jgi:5-methylcytosine-specific restriction endonuclease McrA
MPKSAKRPDRPFVPKRQDYNQMQGQGRAIVSKFYKTKNWRQTSIAYRMEHPTCECKECKEKGRILPSEVTDHIKPINPRDAHDTQAGRYGEPLDWDNLQAMSTKCHNKKSAKERWGKKS